MRLVRFFRATAKWSMSVFDDPPKMARELAEKGANEEAQLECYRKVRDEIKAFVEQLPEILDK